MPSNIVIEIENAFKKNANPEKAKDAEWYMKYKFSFYGIQQPIRKELYKGIFKDYDFSNMKNNITNTFNLWEIEQREFQYAAFEFLERSKKYWDESIIEDLEQLIVSKSWWDTVDFLASNLSGFYFKKFPHQIQKITPLWNNSSNMWLNRSAIIFQLKFKEKMDTGLLTEFILTHNNSKEFFIQKAIGWVLREYGKTNPEWVKQFISNHALAALSLREAKKYLDK